MSKTPLRFDLFWLGLYAILDLSWIWHDQIAYNDSGFDYRVVLRGIGCAPEQYRIAAPITASWIARHLHLHSFTAGCIVIDLLGSLLLSVLLYALVSQYLGAATLPVRNLAKLFTGLWMLFYLHWTYGSVRVETVPSCIYVVLSLLLLSRLSSARLKEAVLSIAALLALALLQGWIRADVAVVFSVGVCLASLFPIAALASTRRVMSSPRALRPQASQVGHCSA